MLRRPGSPSPWRPRCCHDGHAALDINRHTRSWLVADACARADSGSLCYAQAPTLIHAIPHSAGTPLEINSEVVTTPPRPAATVVMLRDADAGMQVFLQRRHSLSDVLGGAYVFPGGKVDAQDAELDMETRLDRSAADLHASLHEHALDTVTAASLYVAAVREVFEESGVLFARDATPWQLQQAQALLRDGCGFGAMLGQLALRLQTHSLVPWSRWITPRVPTVTNKRFDTRFFVSEVPVGQTARHDNHEATESVWLTPSDALGRYWADEIELAPPQIMSLAHLSRYQRVADVLSEARGRRPPVVAPQPFDYQGLRAICYPGDQLHRVRERALPGPTRLVYRNRRFEPVEGFDALFADAAPPRTEP